MEALKSRAIALLCIFFVCGSIIAFAPKPGALRKSEEWLEQQTPTVVGRFHIVPTAANPHRSYRMDATSYDTLKPFGIVCQTFTDGAKTFDVVLIVSDSHQSFHEPRICFQTQGWSLDENTEGVIQTLAHGAVPVTLVKVTKQNSTQVAAFTYSGPSGFRDAPLRLMRDMFFYQLSSGRVPVCKFYRFIALYPGAKREELLEFAGHYLDAANKSSNGFF